MLNSYTAKILLEDRYVLARQSTDSPDSKIITNLNKNKMNKFTEEVFFTQEQSETLLNDTQRKELFKRLFELYANSMPMIIKFKKDKFIAMYNVKVEELANEIKKQIELRDNQIFKSFK